MEAFGWKCQQAARVFTLVYSHEPSIDFVFFRLFPREQDTARIGRLVYKFPRLLLMDVNAHLIPRADDFRKVGLARMLRGRPYTQTP